jgi:dihydrofolate reductase
MSALVLVAALDRRGAIGRGNELPWRLPDDLKRFKALTRGRTVLMGRKTAESLGRALPERRNLVLTRTGRAPFEGMEAVDSLDAARVMCTGQELMVIGGGEVYSLALPSATRLHLTHVDTVVSDADAFFPELPDGGWEAAFRETHAADARHAFAFEFVDYVRVAGPRRAG